MGLKTNDIHQIVVVQKHEVFSRLVLNGNIELEIERKKM